MTPISWDFRLENFFSAQEEANKHTFINDEERCLFINATAEYWNNSKKYNVVYRKCIPIVIDGRVKRRYING